MKKWFAFHQPQPAAIAELKTWLIAVVEKYNTPRPRCSLELWSSAEALDATVAYSLRAR